MGIDLQALHFLLRSKNAVSFDRFLMLGRQWCHVPRRKLKEALRRSDFDKAATQSAVGKASASGFMEPVLELLGARRIDSMDFSDYEQATIIHDINVPIPESLRGKFSCVYDGGTLEHVFDFPRAIKNAMDMVSVGGHFMGVAPGNNLSGHGFYQFSPELYWRIFSEENGFAVEEVSVCETQGHAPSYRIVDPAALGRRVEFTNSRPLYVMVRARRLREAEIFKTHPQQPYYEAAWSAHSGIETRRAETKSLRDWARRSLPESVKRLARPFAPQKRSLRFSGFKKM